MHSLSYSNEFQLSSVAFFGRTFDEYVRFFGLDACALPGLRVLDVAAGPSSFTFEAHRRGIRAAAVDPLYGYSPQSLDAFVRVDYERVMAEVRLRESLLRYRYFPSIEAAEASRRAAAARFLSDYEDGFVQDRYIGGSLPRLRFADRSFDLVLCAHLLFTYARHFDYDWHLEACLELLRVSAAEVRIHPVCGPDGLPYGGMSRLRRDLESSGADFRLIDVDYEFFAGTGSTLVLTRGR
jgi:hypothetical protein